MPEIPTRREHLSGADMHLASLPTAPLAGADLRKADLREAWLRDTCLHAADLRDADLRDATLEGADLDAADLRGAILDGADLRGEVLAADRLADRLPPTRCGSHPDKPRAPPGVTRPPRLPA